MEQRTPRAGGDSAGPDIFDDLFDDLERIARAETVAVELDRRGMGELAKLHRMSAQVLARP